MAVLKFAFVWVNRAPPWGAIISLNLIAPRGKILLNGVGPGAINGVDISCCCITWGGCRRQ
jgi:hypothetical protein